MHDAGVRRDDLERVERVLAPAQELVPLLVALELLLGVLVGGVELAEVVDLHGVVDDELGRDERLDLRRVAAELGDRVTHGGEVDDGRHAREVLQHHAGGREVDLGVGLGLGVPRGERLDRLLRHRAVALGAQQVLQQHLQGVRKARHVVLGLERVEAEDLVRLPADFEV